MKLKTLKDIKRITECQVCGAKTFFNHMTTEDLKAEAIKDYKKFSKKTKEGVELSPTASYIKLKNNLTEEDLTELKGGVENDRNKTCK